MYTLLHISDLHRSERAPISNSELRSSLLTDLDRSSKETPSISAPDAIIVSGDIVQGLPVGTDEYPEGLQRQYEEALEFLADLAGDLLNGDRSRVVIVPGNHDVDWNQARSAMEFRDSPGQDIRKLIIDPTTPWRLDWKTLKPLMVVDFAKYEERFRYFCDFYTTFYESEKSLHSNDPARPWNLFALDGGRIVVCGLNSSTANDQYQDIGTVRGVDLADAHMDIIRYHSTHSLLIGVWHHDVKGSPLRSDYIDPDAISLMIDKGFGLGLNGHQHRNDVSPFDLYLSHARESMAVVSAGSLCAGPEGLPPGVNRQYNVLEINDDYGGARIHVRSMNVPSIFGPGQHPRLGGDSYVDITWSPPKELSVTDPVASVGSAPALFDEIEYLIRGNEYDEARRRLKDTVGTFGPYHRRLLSEVLFRAEKWECLLSHLDDPASDTELAQAFRASEALQNWSAAESLLQSARGSGRFNDDLVTELSDRLRAFKSL